MLSHSLLIPHILRTFATLTLSAGLFAFSTPRAEASLATFYFTPFEFDYAGGLSSPALQGSLFAVEVHSVLNNPKAVIFNVQNLSDPNHPNISPTAPTATNIYFDDNYGLLNYKNVSLVGQSPSTSFNLGSGSPSNVPGGSNIAFSSDFQVSATPPPVKNGLDPGEFVMIQIGLKGNATAADVVAAMSLDQPKSNLRLAMHVREIGEGNSTEQSAGFVTVVPEPGSALLIAVSGLMLQLRRKRR